MEIKKEINFNQITLLNLLIACIPLSIIVGNLFINVNIFLIIIFGIYKFKTELFIIEKNLLNSCLIAFFLYLIFVTFLTATSGIDSERIIKSILFLRYLFLFIVVAKLIEKNELNISYIFYSGAFFSFILGLDMLSQYIFDVGLAGNKRLNANKISGFFGDEYIAGGYIKNFSFFLILFLPFIKYNLSRFQISSYLIVTTFYSFIIILISGNRMPLLLFLLSITIFALIEKKLRNTFLSCIIVFLVTFGFFYSFNAKVKQNFHGYYYYSKEIVINLKSIFLGSNFKQIIRGYETPEEIESYQEIIAKNPNKVIRSAHLRIFNSGVKVWKQNKIFGSGIKSFRYNCLELEDKSCSTHPHNYYIEILAETGLVGLILLSVVFLIILRRFYSAFINKELIFRQKIIIIPSFLIFFSEIFPLRSTGSFFTTSNAVIFFLMLAIVAGSKKLSLKKINN